LNPYEVWQRQRLAFVQREIDTQTILELESVFVESILAGKGPKNSKFEKYVTSDNLSKDVRAILQSMIASGLYALLFG
jgi:hypothetical protein